MDKEKTLINCHPIKGIGNRLRWMTSCLVNYDNIYLKWDKNDNGGNLGPGVCAAFEDLFVNKYSPVPADTPFATGAIFLEEDLNYIHPSYGLNEKHDDIRKKYLDIISTFEPTDTIKNLIKSYEPLFTEDTITFSVRTFSCFKKEMERFGIYFKIDQLFQEMDKYDNPIFVTCDSQIVFDEIKKRYGSKCFGSNKRTFFGDNGSVTGMEDIIVDLYLGGKNKIIIGSAESSFTQLQWWFGGGNSGFRHINVINKRVR